MTVDVRFGLRSMPYSSHKFPAISSVLIPKACRDDLVAEAREAVLIDGEAALPFAQHLELDLSDAGGKSLAAIAAAVVPSLHPVAKLVIHLGIERAFDQGFLGSIRQAAFRQGRSSVAACQKLPDQIRQDRGLFASQIAGNLLTHHTHPHTEILTVPTGGRRKLHACNFSGLGASAAINPAFAEALPSSIQLRTAKFLQSCTHVFPKCCSN